MLCQKCHKNTASVRYAEVVDGEVSNLNLCPECLSRHQDAGVGGFELSEPTHHRPSEPSVSDRLAASADSSATCEACDTDLKTIIDTGSVGCSTCYESFPIQLESILEGIHIALNHRGKVPNLDDDRVRQQSNLQSKRSLLKTALTVENYEEAASLRDEIRILEIGLGTSDVGAN